MGTAKLPWTVCCREDNTSGGSSGYAGSVAQPGSFFLLNLHRKHLNDGLALGYNLLFLKELTEPKVN